MTIATLTLFSDAKARTNRFAICDRDGAPVWHGRFFENDQDYDGEQSSGEMAAAKKAVWLAGHVKAACGAEGLCLTLKVDAEWLTWANEAKTSDKGGKARALAAAAARAGIDLLVDYVRGADNPADRYTVGSGYATYKSVDLAMLVDGAERPAPVRVDEPEAAGATSRTIVHALARCVARAGDRGATVPQIHRLASLMAEAGEDGNEYVTSTTLALTKREASDIIDTYVPKTHTTPTAMWRRTAANAWEWRATRVFRKYLGRGRGYSWRVVFPDEIEHQVESEREGKAYAEAHIDAHIKTIAAPPPDAPPKGILVREAYPAEWAATKTLSAKARSRAQSELYRRYDAEHGAK